MTALDPPVRFRLADAAARAADPVDIAMLDEALSDLEAVAVVSCVRDPKRAETVWTVTTDALDGLFARRLGAVFRHLADVREVGINREGAA